MNPIILTKISKHTLIGSLSALLAFVSKFNPSLQRFFIYLYAGTLAIIIVAALWEGRELMNDSSSSPEETLINLTPVLSGKKSKRQYLLSPKVRLELVIGLVVVTVSALIGAL